MSTTQPIKNEMKLEKFKEYFLLKKPNYRNYAMIVLGLNTAFRISDLLNLQWRNVYNDKEKSFKKHICVREHKTGKERMVAVNANVCAVLTTLRSESCPVAETDYLFPRRCHPDAHLSRSQAFRLIREAADYAGLEEHISCHSLRKTFGYHAWKQGAQPAILMGIFNHSSYSITKQYLCIEQDDKDVIYMNVLL